NETHNINENTSATGDLTNAGDSDPDGTALTANTTPVSGPTNGNIVINPDGTYTYTPNPNFNGTDMVVVSICDAGTPLPALCVNDTIFINIGPVNEPPVVDNETHTIPEDTQATGDLTDAGDSDPDGTALTANTTPVSGPTNGTIVINTDGTYTYTPNANFNGTDQVVVSICDAGLPLPAMCTNDTIFITVTPVNDPPVVDNETHTIPEDTQATGDLTNAGDSDPDGTALTANTTPVSGPTNGTIVINADGTYTYTPNANFNGTDQVVVSICDAGIPLPALCVNDTIFITVTPVNDPPVVDNETHTIPEDTQATGDLTNAGDSDPEGTALTANTTPVSGPTNGTIVINTDGTYTYTPNANFNGTDQIVVSICDAGLPLPSLCTNDTIFITVTPVNDPPVVDNELHNILMNTSASGDLTDAGDSDVDGNLVVNTTPAGGPDHGTIVINPDGTYTYTPNNGYFGSDTVIVQICDDGTPLPALCVNDTIFINIGDVNEPPTIDNEHDTIAEDTPATGDLTDAGDFDPDGNLVVNTTPLSGPDHGTIVINTDGTYTYTPGANYNGSDTVIVQICDDGTPLPAICVNDTIFITITPVNDPPVVDNENHTIPEDTQASGDLTDTGDSDVDGNLVVNTTPVSGPAHGTVIVNPDGTYTYTPNGGYNGQDTIIVQICDDGTPLPALCVNDTIFITVSPVNDPPVVDNEHHTINEDTQATGDLTDTGDSDPDGTALTANTTPVSGPSNGTIVINTDGTYTYTPDANFNGADTVVVSICDSGIPLPAQCVNDTIFITVNPVNDPPVIDNEHHTIAENTTASGDLTNAGDSDVDGNLVVNTTPVSGPNHGTIVINSDGTYTYTPDADYNGPDTVIVQICDDGTPLPALCVNDTIFITVTPVNEPPVVDNEHHTINEDTQATGDLTDAGDSDPDGTALTASTTPVSGPSNGTIVINPDGTYTYTPNPNFNGTDMVVVSICDSGIPLPAQCVNDTIFITVNPVNDAPVVDNEHHTIDENTTASGDLTDAGDSDVDGNLVVNTTPVDGPHNGTIVINPDGTYTYTPNNGFAGNDTVIVQICDDGTPLPALCVNDTIFITVNPKGKTPDIKVPQAFTPDGDGVNDAFVIAGAENYPNNKLIIYNRWGNVVYETDGYQNDWKGISTSKLDIIGGDELPTATYYYIFDTKDESLDDKGVFKGYIYLKR
ncbi:Ig-like domain-containing protein, partial [Fluviicola sp.]|uniref:tandem-95 repeat protein n=1 Tax=Fluviicola sp. TaxID=1917219 RepID=UPI002624CF48